MPEPVCELHDADGASPSRVRFRNDGVGGAAWYGQYQPPPDRRSTRRFRLYCSRRLSRENSIGIEPYFPSTVPLQKSHRAISKCIRIGAADLAQGL